jgi:hypothetical protein
MDSIKQGFNKMVLEETSAKNNDVKSITEDITTEITKAKITIDDLVDGPIKRQS